MDMRRDGSWVGGPLRLGKRAPPPPPRATHELPHMPEPTLGDGPIHKWPDQFGRREEDKAFTASICFLWMRGSGATSVGSYHRALAKSNEATHSPKTC